MKTLKIFLSLLLLAVSVITINHFLPGHPGLILGTVVFTAPGGIATPFAWNMPYMPQFLIWNNVVPLTSLMVETKEDGVLHSFNAAALAAINGYMMVGAQAANINMLRLADGRVDPRGVTISGVTSAAGAIAFNECSDTYGTKLFKSTNGQIRAGVPETFQDFTAIWVPTMAAGDTAEVTYRNGHRQTYNIAELAALSPLYQEVPGILINNINAYISRVTFTCAALTPAYIRSVLVKS
jgi:hypothetical protein